MFKVAGLTFKEATKKRILLAALVLTAGFLALYATGAHFALKSFRQTQGLATAGIETSMMLTYIAASFLTAGLFVASLVGALLASFLAVGTISSEIEQGTLQSVATRPLPRRGIVLGKWLGYLLMVSLYVGLLFGALVLIVYSQSGWYPPQVFRAGLVFVLEAVVVLSVALLGSTFLNTTANGIAVFMLFAVALVGGSIEQFGTMLGKKILYNIGIVSGLIMPSDNLYRLSVSLITPRAPAEFGFGPLGPFGSQAQPSVWSLAYALFFIAVSLIVAIRVFSRKDL